MVRCQEAGIPWFSYDVKIEGDDAYYGWDNYDLGYAIGENAANWINQTFSEGDTVYAASNNYPPGGASWSSVSRDTRMPSMN